MTRRTILILILIFFTSHVSAQKRISGMVVDGKNGTPLSGVHVISSGEKSGSISDSHGKFSIELKNTPNRLYFSHLGYVIHSIVVNNKSSNKIRVELFPEQYEIAEVKVTGQRVERITNSDTINILDYQILKDRILFFGNPYKNANDTRIYLANLSGDTLSSRKVAKSGRMIKYPEILSPQLTHSFKDCFGHVQYLTRDKVWQVYIRKDSIFILYPSLYEDFLQFLFPIKTQIDSVLCFQVSDKTYNHTYLTILDSGKIQKIKTVYDPHGATRYIQPPHKNFYKYVSAPVFSHNDSFILFDFFDNEMNTFSIDGSLINSVPIKFHLREYREALFFKEVDLDQRNFSQQIYKDDRTGRYYAFYKLRRTGRQSLREIDINTGIIVRTIEIPDFPNVSKISVYNNTVYFIYGSKLQPYYQSLYKMRI